MGETRTMNDLLEALADLIRHAEQDELKIEREWGSGRTLAEIEAAGQLPEPILRARAAVAKALGDE